MDRFLCLSVLLQSHADLSVRQEDQAVLFQLFHRAVDRLDCDPALLIERLACLRQDDLLFFLDIHGRSGLEYVIQQDKVRRIEEAGATVVGGAVELICHLLGDETEEMDILCDPVLKIFPGEKYNRRLSQCLDGDGGLFHSGEDRDLPDKIDGLVFLDHVDISVLKFIDDPVLAFDDQAERGERVILLMDDRPRG